MKKRIINRFNHQNTYLVISDYPEKTKRGEKNYGIAWYTRELLEPLAQKYGTRFVVLAGKTKNTDPETFQKQKILVLRIFDQKHFSLFPRILKWLLTFNHIKKVQVHSEFCAEGGIKNFILLLPFLILIKLTGKDLTYFAHNVVTNLDSFAPHLNLKAKSLKLNLLNFGLKYYYKALGLITDRFVVLDEAIQKRLSLFVSPEKIILNPFFIKRKTYPLTQEQAKIKLGIKNKEHVLMCFGFTTYYKGADWIIKTVKELKRKNKFRALHLILAGGLAYSLKGKKYYQKYYKNLESLVKNNKNIRITGFVPESKIGLYFTAADLVVLPYRGLIGASGSLTHALSFSKPFIISEPMRGLLDNQEVRYVFDKNGLSITDIIFKHDIKSFEKILKKTLNPEFLSKLTKFSYDFGDERSFNKLIGHCYNELYSNSDYAKRVSTRSKLLPQANI